jgi:hypothetical protein
VALSGLLGAPGVLRAATRRRQLNVAAVGVNGMGWSDLNNIGTHAGVHFAGFCDIDSSRFDKADAAYPGVKHWADYREMFEQLGTGFDAVFRLLITCMLPWQWQRCRWGSMFTARSL